MTPIDNRIGYTVLAGLIVLAVCLWLQGGSADETPPTHVHSGSNSGADSLASTASQVSPTSLTAPTVPAGANPGAQDPPQQPTTLTADVAASETPEEPASNDDAGQPDALAWIREVWDVDAFCRWVETKHPVADSPSDYAMTDGDARFAHECVTYVLAIRYALHLNGDRYLRDGEREILARKTFPPHVKELQLSELRARRTAYVALFAVLPDLQAGIEAGAVRIRLSRVPMASGRYSSTTGGSFSSIAVDRKKLTVGYVLQAGCWNVSLRVPSSFLPSQHREALFPRSDRRR